jgi:hypothetical protein
LRRRRRASNGPENLTLRLGDLAPGYLVGDDSGCGLVLIGEGSPRELSGLRRHRHRGCASQFERLWVAPGGPGWVADIDYGGPGLGVKLGLWRPPAFARFRRSRLGRLVRTQRCVRRSRLDVPGGRAVIYAGHARPSRRCGERPRDRYLAHVFLEDVVVTVNVPFCFCPILGSERASYDTLRGMRAIVRNLEQRPPA